MCDLLGTEGLLETVHDASASLLFNIAANLKLL